MEQKKNFHFFAIGSILYALLYTFFLYKNTSGITYPFFVGGTCLFFFLCLKKLGITAKKDSIFYVISLLLLGLSTCLTTSVPIIAFNKIGIFLLMFCLMLHNFFEDAAWSFEKYTSSIARLIVTCIPLLASPFQDLAADLKSRSSLEKKEDSKIKYVVYGLLIACPLALLVLALLSSADQMFRNLLQHMFRWLNFFDNFSEVFGIFFTFCFAFFACYCLIENLRRHRINPETTDKRIWDPVIAITFTSLISIIYLTFSLIQIIFLFLRNMQLPAGYTYASYARQGFFQLLFVCMLNLVMVLYCLARFRPNLILKILLTIISFCTFIMILSSALRMLLYIQTYDLTFLRFLVLWALIVIFLLMIGVVILIYAEKFPLFKYTLLTVTCLYLLLSFLHPDYWIAKYNYQIKNQEIDGYYLYHELSFDAAPILLDVDSDSSEQDRSIFLQTIKEQYILDIEQKYDDMSLRQFNFSLFIAHVCALKS